MWINQKRTVKLYAVSGSQVEVCLTAVMYAIEKIVFIMKTIILNLEIIKKLNTKETDTNKNSVTVDQ